MQSTDEAWLEYVDHAIEPTMDPDTLEVLRMAHASGRLSAMAAIGAAAKSECWCSAWKRLIRDAIAASQRQALRVNALQKKYARIAGNN